jgi:transcriptional regulator with GAF, ATPase, and Fis domain
LILGAIRAGHLYDYVVKPYRPESLRRTVQAAAAEHERRRRIEEALLDRRALEEEVLRLYDPTRVVGETGGLRETMAQVAAVASRNSTVLLLGETGTGKEMIARAIHARSPRAHRALVKVDCAALAPTLIESELFGHVRGAFTGATRERPGRFEQAHGGTVFLDEVGDIPLELQSRLLRVVQDREVDPVGGARPVTVDVRIIAATRRDLREEVAAGRFREDLYYRLAVVPILLPPLRDRLDDIPLLVRHFLAKHAPGRSDRMQASDAAVARLTRHDWPGNVRELENLVERAVVLGAGPILGPDDLAPFVPPSCTSEHGLPELTAEALRREADRIRAAIARTRGNLSAAARILSLPRSTLLNRARQLGIR